MQFYSPNLFCETNSLLGEAPLWSEQRQSLLFLDILNQQLFEKKWQSEGSGCDHCWQLPEVASSLAEDASDPDCIWMVTDQSVGKFHLETSSYERLVEFDFSAEIRANDGSVGPDGGFWFGTMQRHPVDAVGKIWRVDPRGILELAYEPIGIPNTFTWTADGSSCFISDSMSQKLYRFKKTSNATLAPTQAIYRDFSGTPATPDGGALDHNGGLWLALWGGGSVVNFDTSGRKVGEIDVGVPQPSSCCFGGPDYRHLFITSAREGLTPESLLNSPASGSTFSVEVGARGTPVPRFQLED